MDKSLLFEALSHFRTAQEEFSACSRILLDLIADEDTKADFAALQHQQIDEHLRRIHARTFGRKETPVAGKEENRQSKPLKFTKKEMETMPVMYKNLFFTENAVAHVRLRKDNLYEIRCQINGKKITASGKTLETAKKKFIGKIHEIERTVETEKAQHTFGAYALEWLETVKRPTVKETTLEDYRSLLNVHLIPAFGKRPLSAVTRADVQTFLNGLIEQGKSRAAHKMRQILASIYEYAIIDDLVTKSPVVKIRLPVHESVNGTALSLEEERAFVQRCLSSGTQSGKAFVFLLCTGLRRSELPTARIDGEWIIVSSAKQRLGKREKLRKVPISPRLRRLLPNVEEELPNFQSLYLNRLQRTLKEWLPNHHLHDTRHTFITRAQECGIAREVVSLWAGHKADNTMTSNVYTHFSDAFQLSEIKKFDY